MDLDLDPYNKMIGGEVDIHFRALEKLKTLRIDLYKNLHINSLKLEENDITFFRSSKVIAVIVRVIQGKKVL